MDLLCVRCRQEVLDPWSAVPADLLAEILGEEAIEDGPVCGGCRTHAEDTAAKWHYWRCHVEDAGCTAADWEFYEHELWRCYG